MQKRFVPQKNDYRDAEATGHRTYIVVPRSLDQVNLLVSPKELEQMKANDIAILEDGTTVDGIKRFHDACCKRPRSPPHSSSQRNQFTAGAHSTNLVGDHKQQ